MTPKEKAKELVDKYDGFMTYIESKGKAKDCAMASVEELINQCWSYREIDLGMSLDYWEEVKKEINKI